jgi:uncharacterized protein YbjT (DUF2867 family)
MTVILVVGSTGTVGRGVVRGLVERGLEVRAATRDPSSYDGPGTSVRLDLADPATWPEALDGVTDIFQVTPAGHADAHALLGPFIAKAAETVGRFVTMSAQGVEFSDEIPLRRVELAVEATGRRFTHLRPTWFADNFHSYWRAPLVGAGVLPLPAADSRTAFVDARDISATAVGVLTSDAWDGQALEVTGPEALTYAEAAAVLADVLGTPVAYVDTPEAPFAEQLRGAGMSEAYVQLLLALFVAVRAGGASAVTDVVERVTGTPPRALATYARDRAELLR